MQKDRKTGKVAIIGSGFVGATAAYTLLVDEIASEISLIDVNKAARMIMTGRSVEVTVGPNY